MSSNTRLELLGRVDLISSDGRWLGKKPAFKARELLDSGRASVDETRGNKISAIKFGCRQAVPEKAAKPLTPASYQGQRYVMNVPIRSGDQQIGRAFQHREDILENREIFLGVIADVCTVK